MTKALALALGLSVVLTASPGAGRGRRRTSAKLDPAWASAPSAQYAALGKRACLAALGQRGIRFQQVDEAPGVLAPVRVVDGVGGVLYRTALSRARRLDNPHDVFDCRLVLALHDFSAILRQHGIDEVQMFSGWRPPRKGWPKGKLAVRHPGGLAIDIYRFGTWEQIDTTGADEAKPKQAPAKRRRVWLDVHKHFNGRIGWTTCGPKAHPPQPKTPQAETLRALVCEAAQARIFTSILTPHNDRAHFNHLHFDLTAKVHWRIVR